MSDLSRRVLVLAPTGRDAVLSCAMLREEGFSAEACESMAALCAAVSEDAGALLIGEEALNPSSSKLLVDTLDHQPQWSDISVIVLAGREFSDSTMRPLKVLGPLRNVLILERPVRRLILARTVAIALRGRQRQLELRAYLEERADLLRREQVASRMKDEFLMTVSHELRTPLTAIYGWARMLVTGEIREDQKRRAIEAIERNAEAQTQLVNDLLDVSRAMSGKVQLQPRAVDLNRVVVNAIESVQPAADAKGIRLQTQLASDGRPLWGDPDRLQQVIWNLLSNAVKFTPRGGLVMVKVERSNSEVEITVTDSGLGIDAAFLPYVFDRFRQGNAGTTREQGGLGLGLAIVRHLVELHGGSVHVESPGVGWGSTFRVLLPLTAAQNQPEAPSRSPAAQHLQGLRVMVVDDDAGMRDRFRAVAEDAGAEVRVAGSAHDALSIMESWAPDFLLSDIERSEEEGHALMEGVRKLDAMHRRGVIAIAVTTHEGREDRLRALEAGFHWHLPKAVDPTELVTVMASLTSRLKEREPSD